MARHKLTVADALIRDRLENESLLSQARRLGLPEMTIRNIVIDGRRPRVGTKLRVEMALGRKPGSLVA